jgi:hypothetical protein
MSDLCYGILMFAVLAGAIAGGGLVIAIVNRRTK